MQVQLGGERGARRTISSSSFVFVYYAKGKKETDKIGNKRVRTVISLSWLHMYDIVQQYLVVFCASFSCNKQLLSNVEFIMLLSVVQLRIYYQSPSTKGNLAGASG